MRVPTRVFETIVAHSKDSYPNESCGLLAGTEDDGLQIAYPMTNTEESSSRYTIDPTEHFYAVRHSEHHGWDIVGVFHSHPYAEAVPSDRDVELALEPNWLHLILSLKDPDAPDLRGFWITSDGVSEEPLEIVD